MVGCPGAGQVAAAVTGGGAHLPAGWSRLQVDVASCLCYPAAAPPPAQPLVQPKLGTPLL